MTTMTPRGNIGMMFLAQIAFDVTSVAANTTAERTFTVPGVNVGDVVFVNKPSLTAGLGISNVRVSAANTIAITYNNNTAGALDPASETYNIIVIRPDGTPPARLPGA